MHFLLTLWITSFIYSWMGVFQKQYYSPYRLSHFLKKEEVLSKKTILKWFFFLFTLFFYFLFPLFTLIFIFFFHIFLLFSFPKERLKWTTRSANIFLLSIFLSFLFSIFLSSYPFLTFLFIFHLSDFAILFLCVTELLLYPKNAFLRKMYYKRTRKWFLSHPKVKVIAITGSFGKTSMKKMLFELLCSHYKVARTKGTINTPLGISKTVNEELVGDEDYFIAECGVDTPHTMKRFLSLFTPYIVILTGLGEMHLATFHTKEAILKEKLELAQRSMSSIVFYNGEIKEFHDALSSRKNAFPYYANFHIEHITKNGTYFKKEGEAFTYFVSLFGRHQLHNLIGAMLVSNYLKVPQKEIFYRLSILKSEPHRFHVYQKGNQTYIDDTYNTNPKGLKDALETTLSWKGKKCVITSGVVEIGKNKNRLLLEEYIPLFAQFDGIYLVGNIDDFPISLLKIKKVYLLSSFLEAYKRAEKEEYAYVLLTSDPGRYHL